MFEFHSIIFIWGMVLFLMLTMVHHLGYKVKLLPLPFSVATLLHVTILFVSKLKYCSSARGNVAAQHVAMCTITALRKQSKLDIYPNPVKAIFLCFYALLSLCFQISTLALFAFLPLSLTHSSSIRLGPLQSRPRRLTPPLTHLES